jgi:hypothetical protein
LGESSAGRAKSVVLMNSAFLICLVPSSCALLVLEAFHLPGTFRIRHRPDQIALTVFAIAFMIHRALPFHIGLPGEDEDFDRLGEGDRR